MRPSAGHLAVSPVVAWTVQKDPASLNARSDHTPPDGSGAYAEKNGEWLTMSEAAAALRVTNYRIRRLISDRILSAEQVVSGARYQIRGADLEAEHVLAAIARTSRPCRVAPPNQLPMFPEA